MALKMKNAEGFEKGGGVKRCYGKSYVPGSPGHMDQQM